MLLAAKLQEARKGAGKSQRALVADSGIHQTQLARLEAGRDVRASTLIELMRLAGLELVAVPRETVPAVEAMVAGTPADRPLYALEDEDD